MRILFTFVGGQGHCDPLVAIARASEDAGHIVAFGCGPDVASIPRAAGFTTFALGSLGRLADRADRGLGRLELRPLDRAREDRDLRERFARRAAGERVPLIRSLCARFEPDVLVCDETDFGAVIAAELLGLPYATVLVIATGSFVRPELVSDVLGDLRARHGLPPDPELEMLTRYLVLSPFPASYRDPDRPLPPTGRTFRLPLGDPGDGEPAPWPAAPPAAPRVYFTLGTVFNRESGDLFERVLSGLSEMPIRLLVTVGRDLDPVEFGPQSANVQIERFVEQHSLLRGCDLVVSHAGSGSVLSALAHGLPSVLIPIGADQPLNAARCVELGVAKALDAVELTSASVRAAASDVLEDPSYRTRAREMMDEIRAMPALTHVVGLLEELVASNRSH